MTDDELIIVACPSCAQKYRVPEGRIGHRAACKKCGAKFMIARDAPIDEDTLFGWVMEGNPSSESVMGSTAIFEAAGGSSDEESAPATDVAAPPEPPPSTPPAPPPAQRASAPRRVRPKVPDTVRVEFDRIDDIGAYFEFPSNRLADPDLRQSFPDRCTNCLTTENLNVHLLIWGDKLPRKDAITLREAEIKTVRSFDALYAEFGDSWFDHLDRVEMLSPPFDLAFPYFLCHDCSSVGAVTCHVLNHGEHEFCQIAISNLAAASEFYRNNGGRGTRAYQKLLVASRQQRDNQWTSLPFAVRARISQWFALQEGEQFMGYFPDSDFSRAEAGVAGLILTDRRMVYKKYASNREYALPKGGVVEVEASKSAAMIEITQTGQRPAVLAISPLAAASLAKSLQDLSVPWEIQTAKGPQGS